MKEMDLRGVVRGRRVKTTIPANSADRPHDLVERSFKADHPNQLRFADLMFTARNRARYGNILTIYRQG